MEFEDIKQTILQIADDSMKYARDLNIPSAEAFVFKQYRIDLNEQKGKVNSRGGLTEGIGFRVAIGKKLGFASCTGFTPSAIKRSLTQAHQIAQKSPEIPDFPGFISKNSAGKDGILDEQILSITPEDLIKQIDDVSEGVNFSHENFVAMDIDLTAQWKGYAVATTEGCLQATLHTSHENSIGAIVAKNEDRKQDYYYRSGRTIQDLRGSGQIALENALKSLGSQKYGKSEKLPLILHPRTSSSVLGTFFRGMFDGKSFVQKANPLMNKLNTKIAPDWLTISDNGQDISSTGTYAIDTEGNAVQNTKLVENGLFKQFLFDQRYGTAANSISTGNAARTGDFGGIAFENGPFVYPHKFMINSGSKSQEEIITEHDRAIYIEGYPKGLHTTNFLSGDFSLISNGAFLVENGEIVYPLENISLSGNFVAVLMDIKMVGNDVVQTAGIMDSPTVVINDISFSS